MGSKDSTKKSSSVKALENSSSDGVSRGFWWAILAVLVIAVVVVGYIWWDGKRAAEEKLAQFPQEDTSMTVAYEDSSKAVLLSSPETSKDAPTIDFWEDFSCPHCAQLAITSDASIKKAIEAGDLKLRIHTMHFMDRQNQGVQSTNAGQTVFAVAKSGNAKAYWNLRSMFMQEQQNLFDWTLDQFATAAKVFGVDADTVNTIKDGVEQDAFIAAAEIGFQTLTDLSQDGDKVGTPAAFIGKERIDLANPEWVDTALKTVKEKGSSQADKENSKAKDSQDKN